MIDIIAKILIPLCNASKILDISNNIGINITLLFINYLL